MCGAAGADVVNVADVLTDRSGGEGSGVRGNINYHRSLDGIISSLADVIDVADVLTDRSDLLMLRDILI